MSKSRQKHKEKMPPFVPIRMDELESTAYRQLTGNAAKLLPYFKRTCIRAVKGAPDTCTIFGFTYTEAAKYGFSRSTFRRAIQELIAKGFVDRVEKGGLRGVGHTCSKYKLSGRWVTFGGLEWAQQAQKGVRK